MAANLIFQDEVYQIVGASLAVLNGIGHGLNEKPYENALAVEFSHLSIPFKQQKRFPVIWREVRVGEYIPDLIAFGEIIVDTKTIDKITDHERGQMINYLRITGLPLGLIINFKKPTLEWERIVLTR
jgi:GxxExxY protein